MPRQGSESGYDGVNVCSFCIDYLTVTASARNQLRALPVSKLKAYLKAFNIPNPGALEKDDIVQAVLDARQPNGCLPATEEDYYRHHSVPDQRRGRGERRSFLDRAADAAHAARQAYQGTSSSSRLRPPQQSSRPSSQPPPQSRARPIPTPTTASTSRTSTGRPDTQYTPNPYAQPSSVPRPQPPRPTPTPRRTSTPSRPTQPPRPPTPIPSLSELLDRTPEQISALSVHVLKEILHQNHVNARLILEKSDLVDRVKMLIEDERREREREEELRRLEEEEAIEVQQRMMTEMRAREAARAAQAQAQQETPPMAAPEPLNENVQPENGEPPTVDVVDVDGPTREAADVSRPNSAPPAPAPVPAPIPLSTSPSKGLSSTAERSGLCVVCQDADANMALVDCGHLALCRGCSDLIWNTTRECPLCRTRIVTQERMLRIFRT